MCRWMWWRLGLELMEREREYIGREREMKWKSLRNEEAGEF